MQHKGGFGLPFFIIHPYNLLSFDTNSFNTASLIIDRVKRFCYALQRSMAGVVELEDAPDSKSGVPCGHGGSSPPFGTIKDSERLPVISEQIKRTISADFQRLN